MASFEFLFTLFGLMLGLALTEVVGGFARAVKRRGPAQLGVLTPLLSLCMAYEITDFWLVAWDMRETVPIRVPALIGSLVITGLYYFAAVLAWPDEGDPAWDDLDRWALDQKRPILLSITASGLLAAGAELILNPSQLLGHSPGLYAWMTLYFGLLVFAAFAPGRRTTIAAVGLLRAMHLTALVLTLVAG